MNQAIVPFGKYRNQPVELMVQDASYMDWLLAQDWFKSRYQSLYMVVVNNGQAPSETPEHNLLQNLFLDEDYYPRFLEHLFAVTRRSGQNWLPLTIYTIEFEVDGMDVYVSVEGDKEVRDWYGSIDEPHYLKPKTEVAFGEIYIEIKPTLGDDYPAVLRQMTASKAFNKKYPKGEKPDRVWFILFVDQFSAVATREQLKDIFATRQIHVVFRDEVEP